MRTLLQPPGLWIPALSLRGSQGRETWMCLLSTVALTCAKLALLKIIPLAVFPSMVYCPNTKTVGMGHKDSYVEGKIQGRLSIQTPECPMEQGIIIHPDDMGKIWHYHTSYKENVSLRNGSLSLAVQGLRWAQSPVGDWEGWQLEKHWLLPLDSHSREAFLLAPHRILWLNKHVASFFFFFLARSNGLQDLSSPTRDRIPVTTVK